MDEVYLVIGYEDLDNHDPVTRIVAVYPDKETATQHAKLANNTLDNINSRYEIGIENIDDNFIYDVSRTNGSASYCQYYVQCATFVLHVDQYIERFTKQ